MYQYARRGSRLTAFIVTMIAGAVLATPVSLSQPATAEPAASGPVELGAQYKITLNGFEIGDARYRARVSGRSYTSDSDVELSALLGAFHWKGTTRTAGGLSGSSLKPTGYSFAFESTTRSGTVDMGFDANGVNSLAIVPDVEQAPDTVPVLQAHVKSVLDPLSAILALTRTNGGEPCGRKVSVFDGKQRFDLNLIFRHNEAIDAQTGSGGAAEGVVCRVKFTPVAGYRNTPETEAMAQTTGIEIAFRRVPNAGMVVPYRVTLPTLAGPVGITAHRIDINSPALGQVAWIDE